MLATNVAFRQGLSRLVVLGAVVTLCHGHAGHDHGHDQDGGGQATNILELTNLNFDELVGQSKAVVIEFYAPWCGHCKHLQPEYEKLATTFLDSEQVAIAKLNGENHPEYSYKFNVRGFPTILWFSAGSDKPTQEYWGERSAMALLSWINTKLEDPNEAPPDPDEPPPDFDLTGRWVDTDGGDVTITQDGSKVTAKPADPQHWSSAHGTIRDRTIPRMPFNTVVLAGTIRDDNNSIEWSNGVIWNRVVEEGEEPDENEATDGLAEDANDDGDEVPDAPSPPLTKEEEAPPPPPPPTKAVTAPPAPPKASAREAQASKAAANQKKELATLRQRTVALQTQLEKTEQRVAVLYCTIGVLVVLVAFAACRGMGSSESAVEGDAEWAKDQAL